MKRVLATLSAAWLLAGCDLREKPIPVEKSVFGDQVEQIDKAKEVNKEMERRMQDLNQQLEKSGG